ncbi:glycosyltransferase family 39 protein [Picosynechococcus sp. PCC 7003]|uniref:glycosyltransferase family 39 protein n=1 Tax=Picosynechococcus sp. PCC 7003 TaxID=374981 RepID=UPI0028F45916|nr:glycosyltransferase family 39 protein [Picosynechococcus sp. PCC 7003]
MDGHLPYTALLDVKPPLHWYIFASIIWLAQHSFVFLRFLGAIIVALIGFINYEIAKRIWNKTTGLISGILVIFLINLNPGGQSIMSEHLALIPMMLSFALILFCPKNKPALAASGLCMGLAIMIRLNLAYLGLFVGFYILFISIKSGFPNYKLVLLPGICFALGNLGGMLVILLPYFVTGNLEALNIGLIKASLNYSQQSDFLNVIVNQLGFVADIFVMTISIAFSAVFGPTLFFAFSQLIQVQRQEQKLDFFKKRFYIIGILFCLSIEFSILRTSVFYKHYIIQFLPIFSLLAAPAIANFLDRKDNFKKQLVAVILSVLLVHFSLQYFKTGSYCLNSPSCLHGTSITVKQYLVEHGPLNGNIWLTRGHLAYWFAGWTPITPLVTHPSNINKRFLLESWYGQEATVSQEIDKIFAKKPVLIIGASLQDYLRDSTAQARLDDFIQSDYLELPGLEKLHIYQRQG